MEKLESLLQMKYESNGNKENGEKYLEVMYDLYSSYTVDLLNDGKAEEKCQKMLEVIQKLDLNGGIRAQLASRIYAWLGENSIHAGDLEKAGKYCESGLKICRRLSAGTKNTAVLNEECILYVLLGTSYRLEGDMENARKSIELAQTVVGDMEKAGTEENRMLLMVCYNSLGNGCKLNEEWEKAREFYEKALQLGNALIEETENPRIRLMSGGIYNDLGYICLLEGELEKGRDYLEKARYIFQASADESNTAESRRALVHICIELGEIWQTEGNNEKAWECFWKAKEICETLADETDSIAVQLLLPGCYDYLACLCEKKRRPAKSKRIL